MNDEDRLHILNYGNYMGWNPSEDFNVWVNRYQQERGDLE